MSQHVPDDLLHSFVEGDVGEHVAVHIAEHIDSCPSCLNRAVALEPLAAAFAAIPDPEPPADLVAAVMAESEAPERIPLTELALSAVLVGAAALLVTLGGNSVGMAAEFGVVLSALTDVLRVTASGLAGSGAALTMTTLFALGGLFMTARIARPLDLPVLPGRRLL